MMQQYTFGDIHKSTESKDLSRYWCTNTHSSFIHKSNKVESTQVSNNKWMDKQNMIYTYKKILFNLRKEGDSDTHHMHDC